MATTGTTAPQIVRAASTVVETATTGKPKVSRFYRPELDALRFVAFSLVFLSHGIDVNERAGALRNHPVLAHTVQFLTHVGSYGLSLFFFLSSFLITTLLMLERERTGTVAMRNFYVRRVLRIWPLYIAYMLFAYLLGQAWSPAHFKAQALLAYLAISANWYVIATGLVSPTIMFLFSISIEEQFYLVWPAAVRSLSTRGIRNFCLSLTGASLLGIVILAACGFSARQIWFNSITETLFFATGGLLALHLGLRQQVQSGLRFLAGVFVCLASWIAADAVAAVGKHDGPTTAWHALPNYVLIAIGVASLLWAFLHLPRRFLLSPMVYLGRISYGLYVFHGVTILIGQRLIAPHMPHGGTWLIATFVMTVSLAAASYEFLEKPFLKLKHRFELVHSRTA